jgi:hypothetical protein
LHDLILAAKAANEKRAPRGRDARVVFGAGWPQFSEGSMPCRRHKALHGVDRLVEHGLLIRVQLDFDHFFDATRADHGRDADIHAVKAIGAFTKAAAQGRTRFWSFR